MLQLLAAELTVACSIGGPVASVSMVTHRALQRSPLGDGDLRPLAGRRSPSTVAANRRLRTQAEFAGGEIAASLTGEPTGHPSGKRQTHPRAGPASRVALSVIAITARLANPRGAAAA
jgi:hypothetical protein